MNKNELFWLKPLADAWRARVSQGRVPHAVMLLGSAGLGKRSAAAWIARQFLGMPGDSLPVYQDARPEHADFRWISPAEDKHVVGIEAVRELVAELSLTSYHGAGKAAVVDPANAMSTSAANSLLKTLEEPPGNTLLILIADRVGRLPATIFSRCQRINIAAPAVTDSLAWLDRLHPGDDWARALREAGNAPLAAIDAAERMEQSDTMGQAFAALPERACSPLDVAAQWAKFEPVFMLNWLARQVQACIMRSFRGAGHSDICAVSDTVLRGIDRRNLFCYLDTINRLRSQPVGSYNVLLTLESLLIDWAESLHNHREQGIS